MFKFAAPDFDDPPPPPPVTMFAFGVISIEVWDTKFPV